jgi:hypothetical protein
MGRKWREAARHTTRERLTISHSPTSVNVRHNPAGLKTIPYRKSETNGGCEREERSSSPPSLFYVISAAGNRRIPAKPPLSGRGGHGKIRLPRSGRMCMSSCRRLPARELRMDTFGIAMYAGPMKEMFAAHFSDGVPTITSDTRGRKYVYP